MVVRLTGDTMLRFVSLLIVLVMAVAAQPIVIWIAVLIITE